MRMRIIVAAKSNTVDSTVECLYELKWKMFDFFPRIGDFREFECVCLTLSNFNCSILLGINIY